MTASGVDGASPATGKTIDFGGGPGASPGMKDDQKVLSPKGQDGG